jgi:hypothetical protein
MPEEDRKERVDRELIELLNELRVALPGVQVLFAFLLVVPFQQGFATISDVARLVYFAGLASAAVAIAFLIAPASYHRLNLRRGVDQKEQMLLVNNKLVIIGTIFLALGMTCSMFVIADILFGVGAAVIAAGAVALLTATLWYGLPLIIRDRVDKTTGGDSG